MLIPFLIAVALSVVIVGGVLFVIRKKGSSGSSEKAGEFIVKIEEATKTAKDLTQYSSSYVSKEILTSLAAQVEQLKSDLTRETESLRSIEGKLDTAQKTVESRESKQQEIKSAKQEDEQRLEEMLSKYQDISTESIALEQQLANSLKNLDTMLSEVELTNDQRALLTDLSGALGAAGERLRDLLTEYQAINSRIETLKTQHQDLEDEYTKLVEQQLGE